MFEIDPLSGPLARVSPRDRPIPTPELEEALPVLLVSHDRDFLDRVVTSTIAAEGNGRWIEYAGGYTDMLAQRGPAGRRTPPPKVSGARQSRPVREIRGQPAARPSRLSFNDRGALEMLPARIAALQTQIAGLNAVLADPDLYARDPGRFRMTSQALAVARDELAAAEEQWLTLEMLASELTTSSGSPDFGLRSP